MPNSEERKLYKKKWREDHKEHIKQQSKEYYESHKESKKSYNTQYREEHREHINERASKLVACDKCGEYVRYNGLAKHKTTNKCINFSSNNYKKDSVYCGLCGSIVSDNCMVKHQASDKCKKRTELKKQCCENVIINNKID